MSTSLLILIATIIAVITRVVAGFGFSIVFVTFLSIVIKFEEVVRMAILLEVVNNSVFAIKYYKQLQLGNSILLKVFALLGATIGFAILKVLDSTTVVVVSMTVIICTMIFLLKKPFRVIQNAKSLFVSGVLSGILNSWSSMSGPPVVILYYNSLDDAGKIKGALTGYFLLLYVYTLITSFYLGAYNDFSYWNQMISSSLVIIVAFALDRSIFASIDYKVKIESLRRYIYSFILLFAVILLFKTIIK